MAIKKTIEIDVDVVRANGGLENFTQNFKKSEEAAKSLNKNLDNTTDVVKDVGKSTKEVEKNTKTLADGFKGVGLAIKAMGIGLVISAMGTLKEVFMSNQKVADTMATAMGTVVNVFTKVVDVIVSVVEKVNNSSNGFKGLTNTISGLITISLVPLKLGFYAISLAIDEAKLAWEESFFGDGDAKTIEKLNKRISTTKDNIVEVGKDALEAGKKVANNIGTAISEVGAVVEGTIDGVSKISIKSAYEQAKANTELQNTAKLAEANQARLVEQYDRDAEKLRQVRDEERNSVTDRIKANNDLKNVLNNQEKAMLAQADAQIKAAKATAAQNNNIENQVAVTNALANREGVLAQIEGLRSEQKANDLALNKELLDLTKSKNEAETQLAIDQKQFDAERLKDEEAILLAKKSALEFAQTKELERLQNVIETTKAGTQARIDAENEYAAKKQEIENQITTTQDEIDTYRFNKKLEKEQLIIENDKLTFEAKLEALTEQERLITEATNISEEERTKLLKANADARVKIGEEEAAAKEKALQSMSSGLKTAATLLGESTAAGKAAAIAATTIDTIQSGVSAFKGMVAAVPGPVGIALGAVAAAGALASGYASVKKILAVKTPGGGGGGGGVGGGSAPAPPQFNIVGQSSTNQLSQTIAGQQNRPIQTYVVGNQVSTQQSLDRNAVATSTFG
jgi:hypothetical protein